MDPQLTSSALPARQASDAASPQPPNDRELAILRRVLEAVPVAGSEQLLDQLRMLQVMPGSDATCRIYLLHPDAPRARFSRVGRAKLPGRVLVRSAQGRVVGEVSVTVEHGHLRALQFVRHDAQPARMLPDPDLLELPAPEVSADVRAHAARQALAGVRIVGEPATAPVEPIASPRRRTRLALVALACVLALLGVAGFLLGQTSAADLDAARAAGAEAGASDGALAGHAAGTFAGSLEGELGGRAAAYGPAYDAARARVLAAARRAALERRREQAQAAALAAGFPNPSTCIGYESNGTWICS